MNNALIFACGFFTAATFFALVQSVKRAPPPVSRLTPHTSAERGQYAMQLRADVLAHRPELRSVWRRLRDEERGHPFAAYYRAAIAAAVGYAVADVIDDWDTPNNAALRRDTSDEGRRQ